MTPVDLSTAGTIRVQVTFTGTVPPRRELNMRSAPVCAAAHPDPVYDESLVVDNGRVANAVVWAKSGLGDRAFPAPAAPVVIDQRGCLYTPRVAAAMVSQTVEFRNSDPEPHNVRGRPEVVRAWNFMLPRQNTSRTMAFDKPEVGIRLGCDIHPWMVAYLAVFPHPYFAVTPSDGSVTLEKVPPGDYVVAVWHEKLGTKEQTVSLAPNGTAAVAVTFEPAPAS